VVSFRLARSLKGRVKRKNSPAMEGAKIFARFSAHVMLGGSWGFLLFSQSHVVVVTRPSFLDATAVRLQKLPTMVYLRLKAYSFFWLSRGHIVNQEMVGARSTVST